VLATYASVFDADVAMAQLETAKIPAMRDSNDPLAFFGAAYPGPSISGTTVLVPTAALEAARAAVTLVRGSGRRSDDHPDGGDEEPRRYPSQRGKRSTK